MLAPTANSPPSISPFSVALGVLATLGFAAPVVAACWAGEPSAWLEDKHGEANHDVSHYLRHLLLVCLLCCVMSHLNLFYAVVWDVDGGSAAGMLLIASTACTPPPAGPSELLHVTTVFF
jgi:hypothetical protein